MMNSHAAILASSALSALMAHAAPHSVVNFGSSTKGYADSGETISRGSEAISYNPANITEVSGIEPQCGISFLSLKYTYTYEGEGPVAINRTTPSYFLGLTIPVKKIMTIGAFYLPLPGQAYNASLDNVPTRKATSTPMLVHIDQKGLAGYHAGIGFASEVRPNLSFGLGLLQNENGFERNVYHQLLTIKLQTTHQKTTETLINAGARFEIHNMTVGVSSILYGMQARQGTEETWALFSTNSVDLHKNTKYPLNLSTGLQGHVQQTRLFGEASYYNWSSLTSNETDVVDTFSYIIAADHKLSRYVVSLGYGYFPAYQGGGRVSSASPDGQETAGLNIGEIDGVNRNELALGIHFFAWSINFDSYVNYQTGRRHIGADGIAAGEHTLEVYEIGIGGTRAF